LPVIDSEVRECLKLDPDHKHCYAHYKQVKKLNKQIQSAEALIQEQRYTLSPHHPLCVCVCVTADSLCCCKQNEYKCD